MKYLIILFSIVLCLTAASLFIIWPDHPQHKKDILVTVNGYDISRSDIGEDGKAGSSHESRKDVLDSAIVKQLLIQEAQRLDIDKEPSFRKELKEYYEQSLIRVLTDRKYASLHVVVSDEEVIDFINNYGKTFSFYILKSRDLPTEEVLEKNGVFHTSAFGDLSENLQIVLSGLKVGEKAMEYETGNENYAVLLVRIEGNQSGAAAADPGKVRRILLDHKKRQEMDMWINALRKKASITLHTNKE